MCAWGGAKAGKKYWSPSTAIATWTPATNTMTWTAGDYGGYHVMYTGFTPAKQNNATEIDFSDFTKLHFTLSSVTSGSKVQVKFVSTGKEEKLIDLAEGENNIIFADYSTDVDFSKVTEISLWGAGTDAGSAMITNVYMQTVKNLVVCTGLGDEITSLSGITDGSKFVISDGTNAMFFDAADPNCRDAKGAALANVPHDSYYYYTLTKVDGLDLDETPGDDDDLYIVNVVNGAGTAFPNQWGLSNKLNFTSGGNVFSGGSASDGSHRYGQDFDYGGLWKVAYSDGNGFTFKNCSLNKYLKVNGSQDAVCYLHLYESLNFDVNTEFDKEDNAANDAIFAFANATGYDAETGTMTNGGWTFTTPVDISNWDYLVITTIDNASDGSRKIKITDDNGVSVEGNQYTGSDAGTVKDMYLDRWNNQNAIRISIDYLRATKGMDITKIKSLTFANNSGGGDCVFRISNVYLTDYNNTKIGGGYCEGDVKREYTATGKWGTICLPYKASYAGADVYSIEGETGGSLVLNKVTGLLEAGKAYFYKSADVNGQNNESTVRNVNFFRADLDTYDAASPVAAGDNNGLTGTFSATTAPMDSYVLSNQKLYQVDGSVNVAVYKAWVDRTCVPAIVTARGDIYIDFDGETTGINATLNDKGQMTNDKVVYNLAGQRVAQPTKGLYIVNGKKIIIK